MAARGPTRFAAAAAKTRFSAARDTTSSGARRAPTSWWAGGRDVFFFKFDDGFDRVADFEDGEDMLKIFGFGFADLAITEDEGDAVISFARTVVTLRGVSADLLDEDDFIFA